MTQLAGCHSSSRSRQDTVLFKIRKAESDGEAHPDLNVHTRTHTHRHTYKYYNIPHTNYIYTHYNTYTHIPHTNSPPHNTNTQACAIYTTLQTHTQRNHTIRTHLHHTQSHKHTPHTYSHIYTKNRRDSKCMYYPFLFVFCLFSMLFFGYCLSESWFCFPMQIVLIQTPLQSDYRHVSPCLMVLYYFDNFFLYFFSMFISV